MPKTPVVKAPAKSTSMAATAARQYIKRIETIPKVMLNEFRDTPTAAKAPAAPGKRTATNKTDCKYYGPILCSRTQEPRNCYRCQHHFRHHA